MKSLLNKGSTTDFQVRQWGIRRTWKSVVPLNQQAVTRRVTNSQPMRKRAAEQREPPGELSACILNSLFVGLELFHERIEFVF